jgi:hypothetical protein
LSSAASFGASAEKTASMSNSLQRSSSVVQAGAMLTHLQPEQITLEDVYFKLQEQSRQGVK